MMTKTQDYVCLFDTFVNISRFRSHIYGAGVKNTIMFWKLLQEYEDIYSGKSVDWGIYIANNMFGYYKWREKREEAI